MTKNSVSSRHFADASLQGWRAVVMYSNCQIDRLRKLKTWKLWRNHLQDPVNIFGIVWGLLWRYCKWFWHILTGQFKSERLGLQTLGGVDPTTASHGTLADHSSKPTRPKRFQGRASRVDCLSSAGWGNWSSQLHAASVLYMTMIDNVL